MNTDRLEKREIMKIIMNPKDWIQYLKIELYENIRILRNDTKINFRGEK